MDQPEQHSTAAASGRVERRAKSVVRLWPRLQAASLLLGFTGMLAGSDQVMKPRSSALSVASFTASPVATSSSAPSWESFHETVQPVLAQYCLPCHGAERAEKGLRLDLFKDEESLRTHFDALSKSLAMIYAAKMPPPCEYQPSPQESEAVTSWIVARMKAESGAPAAR